MKEITSMESMVTSMEITVIMELKGTVPRDTVPKGMALKDTALKDMGLKGTAKKHLKKRLIGVKK